jgi:hypothetical protein
LISFLRIKIVPLESSFTIALFLIYFALLANSSVESVSLIFIYEGEIFAIITVLLFPPNESLKMNVSLLSLYGTCLFLPSDKSTSELITFPRAERDLLIIPASLSLSPTALNTPEVRDLLSSTVDTSGKPYMPLELNLLYESLIPSLPENFWCPGGNCTTPKKANPMEQWSSPYA